MNHSYAQYSKVWGNRHPVITPIKTMRDDELTMAFFLTGEMSEELEELIQLEKEEHYMRKCDAQKKSKRGGRRAATRRAKNRKNSLAKALGCPKQRNFCKQDLDDCNLKRWSEPCFFVGDNRRPRISKEQEVTEQLEERELTLAENSWSDSDLEMLLEWEAIQAREELRTEFLILVESWLAVHDAL